jgi:hypothetical protein
MKKTLILFCCMAIIIKNCRSFSNIFRFKEGLFFKYFFFLQAISLGIKDFFRISEGEIFMFYIYAVIYISNEIYHHLKFIFFYFVLINSRLIILASPAERFE